VNTRKKFREASDSSMSLGAEIKDSIKEVLS
jgi:hypothetical protein